MEDFQRLVDAVESYLEKLRETSEDMNNHRMELRRALIPAKAALAAHTNTEEQWGRTWRAVVGANGFRLRVPGGWLFSDSEAQSSPVFIPDPTRRQ